MLNAVFVFLVLASIVLAAATGRLEAVTGALIADARKAVELAIGLVGIMAFFLGLMRVARDAGLLRHLARALRPLMRRLFPSVPPDHPAMSAMILNMAANMMGLVNAATPFGIKAMEELDRLNREKGTATNAMALFLAINTSALALLPSGVASMRAAAGSRDVMGIWFPTLFASACATTVAIVSALLLSRLPRYRATEPPSAGEPAAAGPAAPGDPEADGPAPRASLGRALVAGAVVALLAAFAVRDVVRSRAALATPIEVVQRLLSEWSLVAVVAAVVLFGWSFRVRVYESLVEGAKEGFQVALRIIPYLVAILVAVGMFRASGGIELLVAWVEPWTARIGMPAEALPMALLRPLSGSGAYGVMAEIMETHGPDSRIGYLVSTMQGSTETTFYVLAVYYGAVGVKRTRHTVPACLLADTAGILGAVLIVNLLFG